MQEFMLLIRNDIDHQADWSPEKHGQFLRDCEVYIHGLKERGRLIAAQPLVLQGTIISRSNGEWNVRPMRSKGEVQVGYYHVLAENIEEAIELVKGNTEFDYGAHARVEVRPVKKDEPETGFVYPE
jgi:hypothetical protein